MCYSMFKASLWDCRDTLVSLAGRARESCTGPLINLVRRRTASRKFELASEAGLQERRVFTPTSDLNGALFVMLRHVPF